MAGTLCIVFSWFTTKKQHTLWLIGVGNGALLGLSRVIIGAHFLSDVVFSYFLTATISYVLRELYKRLVSIESQI